MLTGSLYLLGSSRLVFLTNHQEQLNLSLQSDSAPLSVLLTPTCSAVFLIPDKGTLWHCATENSKEEQELFQVTAVPLGLSSQAELVWISLAAN